MPVEAATASAATAAAQSKAGQDQTKLADDFSDFLTLLTTQLQNQDPLDPMDSGEFTNQLVAFTGVEQQIRTNQNLEQLTALTQLNNIGNIAGYIGYDALVEAPFGDHTTDGIKWQYSNAEAAKNHTLQVLDEEDNVIFETNGELGVGLHEFNWDGKDKDGNLATAGNYRLKVIAEDPEGKALASGIAVQETITAVHTGTAIPTFSIGPNTVPQTDIIRLMRNPI
ncbi:MAG: flagellar hook assembly protein FlgD [Kordiimonas sp.]